MQFIITSEYAKMRLDKFLKEHLPEMSRAHLQKLVQQRQVTVNGKPVTPHHFLKAGDVVEATIETPQELLVTPNPSIVFHTPPQPPLTLRGGEKIEPPLRIRGCRGSYDNVVVII